MPTPGRYVYGIVRTIEDRDYGCIGLEHAGSPGRVFTVQIRDCAAVVSAYGVQSQVLPLRKNLDPHNRVIREVMKQSTIIPMTFGHVARNEEEVVRLLRRNQKEIRQELDRLDGKVEMSLKVNWDVDNIFEYFVASDEELAAWRDKIFGRSHSPSQADKIELGRRFEELLNREREKQTELVVEAFRPCCSEIAVNPPKNEKSVMDLAFLVDRERTRDFEERVNQVAGTFPGQYLFDYGGPWAPFNFAELDLQTVGG
jgi:hypothetical protein